MPVYLAVGRRFLMGDRIILATARMHGALLWTQDADFREIESVRYIAK